MLAASGLLLVPGCGKDRRQDSAPASAVAVVAGRPISVEQFQSWLAARGRQQPGSDATLEQKEALLEELIRSEVLYVRALSNGFDRRPEIAQAVRQLIIAKFQEEELQRAGAGLAEVSAEEVRSYYQQNQARYQQPAAVSGAVIFLGISAKATREKREAREAEARQILDAAAGENFAALAAKHSEDQATRYQGGATGWLTREASVQTWEPEVISALFALRQPGELGPLVSTTRGFYVIRLAGKRSAATRPLEQVQDSIRHHLFGEKQRQARERFFATMKAGVTIQINRTVLEQLAPLPQADPPSVTPTAPPAVTSR